MASNTDFLLSIRTSVKLHETLLKKICETCRLTLIEGKVIAFLHNNPGKDTAADIAEFRMLLKGKCFPGCGKPDSKRTFTANP